MLYLFQLAIRLRAWSLKLHIFFILKDDTRHEDAPLDVASCHEPLIKMFGFVPEGSMDLHYCFYPYYFAGALGFKNPNYFLFWARRIN